MSTQHSKAAKAFLQDQNYAKWHDNTFWSVRTKRDKMACGLKEWEQLREKASAIKRHTITHLDAYVKQFMANAEKNGCIVHWAKDAREFNETVLKILQDHGVKKMVKSKSMLTEECEMNPYLEEHGIEVVETDLGERIIQLKGQKPSHIVMPAIHLNHDDVGELFEEKGISDEKGNHDPTYLTYRARLSLRNEFLTAQAGMTGANFGIADTGDIVVCTNEGNADMSTSCPPLHIAAIGLEKIIPNYDCLAVFQRMLCRAGTGQPTTTYTSHFRKARPTAHPMHIILVDNGRTEWVKNPDHWEVLKCIRCGSCMNTCPVYRRSGGYSYSYFIPGPIGINLGMLRDVKRHSGNVSACTLCLSCQTVCPVKLDLGDQIYKWRQKLDSFGTANPQKKLMCRGMSTLFGSSALYKMATAVSPLANIVPPFLMNSSLNPWAEGHEMMKFPKKPFHSVIKEIEDLSPIEGKPLSSTEPTIEPTPVTMETSDYPLPPLDDIEATTYPDPLKQFIEMSQSVGGKVVELQPGQDINSLVRQLYPDAREIASNLSEVTIATRNPDTIASAQALNGTDVGIIRGKFGVAENGCVWVPQTMKEKVVCFISENLVILLPRTEVVNNMHEAYRRVEFDANYDGYGTFISGPSKTADIAQVLVMGAQAARSVTVVLV